MCHLRFTVVLSNYSLDYCIHTLVMIFCFTCVYVVTNVRLLDPHLSNDLVITTMRPWPCAADDLSLPTNHGGVANAYITPLLKKPSLDAVDVKSYRPISNVSVLPKLLERLVAKLFIKYLKSAKLFPLYQSAYRMNHSTETTVLHVLSEILTAADRGDFSALILDLSAAFDTVDHEI